MKKFVSLLLVAVLLTAIAAPVLADTGTVVGGNLRMRKAPSKNATIKGWLANGTTVSYSESGTTGWYDTTGPVWQHSNLSGWYLTKTGYCMSKYIK